MQLKRLKISNFKNLRDCELHLTGLHALTGPNGSGKTNVIEALQFVIALLSTTETERKPMLELGVAPFQFWRWFPLHTTDNSNAPFVFELDAKLDYEGAPWLISYSLEIETPFADENRIQSPGAKVAKEELAIKQEGRPGPAMKVLIRDSTGTTSIQKTSTSAKSSFETKENMLALHAFEVREASRFALDYPVVSAFKQSMLATNFVHISPSKLMLSTFRTPEGETERKPGATIEVISLFEKLSEIKNDTKVWNEFLFWLKQLCNITDVQLVDQKSSPGFKWVMFTHNGIAGILPMLSAGTAYLAGMLCALFSLRKSGGAFVIDEPETYLHPKALVDLIALFRKLSENNTIIFTTHSPVALNCLNPEEVSLMTPLASDARFYTALPVSEMKEAISALNRGYVSFGDMLEQNFKLD